MEQNADAGRSQTAVDVERHLRAIFYALISLALSLFGYFFLGLGRTQAIGYAASAFLVLLLLNRRAMLGRVSTEQRPTQESE